MGSTKAPFTSKAAIYLDLSYAWWRLILNTLSFERRLLLLPIRWRETVKRDRNQFDCCAHKLTRLSCPSFFTAVVCLLLSIRVRLLCKLQIWPPRLLPHYTTTFRQDLNMVSDSYPSPTATHRADGGGGGGTGSTASLGAWPSWDRGRYSSLSQDPPGFLRIYIRYRIRADYNDTKNA